MPQTITQVIFILEDPLQIVSGNPPVMKRGKPYQHQFAAANGTPPYTWSVHSGSFPAGITMDSQGLVSGTSNDVAGQYAVEIMVQDSEQRGG